MSQDLAATPFASRDVTCCLLAGGTAATGLLFASGVAQADARTVRAERWPRRCRRSWPRRRRPLRFHWPLSSRRRNRLRPDQLQPDLRSANGCGRGLGRHAVGHRRRGAPHVYDSLSDTWQLHGTGVDAAALIGDQGPAVYFRGREVFVSARAPRRARIRLPAVAAAAAELPAWRTRRRLGGRWTY